ncbi:MAG TPA: acylphosphatase [Bryobacterales bacterium]|nr:acylphosphatase [Bryobacterales bacterium]
MKTHPETLARRFVVHGRVQGVGFRYFVRNEAEGLALDGYVKNRADGTVEVCASGGREQIEQLKRRLAQGPRWSRVDRVDESETETAPHAGFHVEY